MTWENVHRILNEKIFLLSSIYIIDPNFAGKLNMHMRSQNKDTLKNLWWLLLMVICNYHLLFALVFQFF